MLEEYEVGNNVFALHDAPKQGIRAYMVRYDIDMPDISVVPPHKNKIAQSIENARPTNNKGAYVYMQSSKAGRGFCTFDKAEPSDTLILTGTAYVKLLQFFSSPDGYQLYSNKMTKPKCIRLSSRFSLWGNAVLKITVPIESYDDFMLACIIRFDRKQQQLDTKLVYINREWGNGLDICSDAMTELYKDIDYVNMFVSGAVACSADTFEVPHTPGGPSQSPAQRASLDTIAELTRIAKEKEMEMSEDNEEPSPKRHCSKHNEQEEPPSMRKVWPSSSASTARNDIYGNVANRVVLKAIKK